MKHTLDCINLEKYMFLETFQSDLDAHTHMSTTNVVRDTSTTVQTSVEKSRYQNGVKSLCRLYMNNMEHSPESHSSSGAKLVMNLVIVFIFICNKY